MERIEFVDAHNLLPGERKSKRLLNNSGLVKRLQQIRNQISVLYPDAEYRPWHIELASGSTEDVTTKALSIQNVQVNTRNLAQYSILNNRAFVLKTPPVDKYGTTHITIAYFRDTITSSIREHLFNLITA